MKLLRHLRMLSALLLLFVGGRGVLRLYTDMQIIKKVVVIHDHQLSEQRLSLLKKQIHNLSLIKRPDLPAFLDLISHEFPEIAQFDLCYHDDQTLICTVATHAPVCTINTNSLLLENNSVAPKDHFKLASFLYDVRVPCYHDTLCSPAQLRACLSELSADILSRGTLIWYGPHDIFLACKDASYGIVFDTEHVLEPNMIEQCAHLITKAGTQMLALKRQKKWIADVRFEKQIVVYADTGGIKYGTHITG